MEIPSEDLELLRSLQLDENAEPIFDMLKYCLTWPDERPSSRLSSEGNEFLSDLWIVRGFIHRALPREQWGLDQAHFQEVWEYGRNNVPSWPGFKRTELSEAESDYLAGCLKNKLSDM
jgi:hypothetical protein